MWWLAALFFLAAALYASVGFGGGSTYNALLVLSGADYRLLPSIALICNILVVAGGTWRYSRAGLVPWARVWPFFTISIPAAWIGGRLIVPELFFISLLGGSLVVAGALMLLQRDAEPAPAPRRPSAFEPIAGGGIGLLSGVVGVGGGIFLAPLLHVRRWDDAKSIAGTASVFILVNSLAGLAGQFAKLSNLDLLSGVAPYWPMFPAVVIGGWIGGVAGVRVLPPSVVRRMTAVLVLYVAARLLWRAAAVMIGGAG